MPQPVRRRRRPVLRASDLKTRWGGWNDDDDDDDHDNDQDDLVFINTETCLELNLNDP
ncbi:hypothetical protein OV079_32695 [Nannocystis pusilla]|uniref:Uncharacterized protein n=1 Tax=Nannocystis pusilla TaxID=889268 RepID=A0A9X3EVT9_9BACT|nr:hypothetical protein [Nannocystis pusilla]MCY1010245.1 hypothetical protein [Nannocystis pusilla]